MTETYDLIVIGSGPAGQRGAIQAAKLGKKVLIIEKQLLGGSCLHFGTVPSKTLREAALHQNAESSEELLEAVFRKTEKVIQAESEVIWHQMERNHVDWLHGTAKFLSPFEISVQTEHGEVRHLGDRFLIATGSRPIRPATIPFNPGTVFDSDTILSLKHLPATLGVIGAGVIGTEYASIFAALGVKVTILDRRTSLLRNIDEDISTILQDRFSKMGIELKLGIKLEKIETAAQATGLPGVRVHTEKHVHLFDSILYCMGRTPNVEDLELEKLGIPPIDRCALKVNQNYQTTIPHIYAVGDIIGAPGLAASAAEQGRLAVSHMFKNETPAFPKTFPYGIYTVPEVSTVGKTEEELKTEKQAYIVGKAYYRELARGKILGDAEGYLKILVNPKSRQLLGIGIIGTGATELIHIGQTAMAFDAKVDFFVENVFNYPTLAEAYKVAALNAYNQLDK